MLNWHLNHKMAVGFAGLGLPIQVLFSVGKWRPEI